MEFCPKLRRARAPAISSKAEAEALVNWTFKMTRDPVTKVDYPGVISGSFWIAFTDVGKEGSWIDYYTKKEVNAMAAQSGDLNGGTTENCGLFVAEWNGWNDWSCQINKGQPISCACQHSQQMYLQMRGLCPDSNIDQYYVPQNKKKHGAFMLIGLKNTVIEFMPEESVWKLAVFGKSQKTSATTDSSKFSYVLGSNTWTIEEDNKGCSVRGQPYTMKLKLTGCQNEEFTCTSGQCISMAERCDQIVHCRDKSDERECSLLVIEDSYNKKVPPFNIDKTGNGIIPVRVNISTILKNVIEISEVNHIIELKFGITLVWYENRVQYHNLKLKEALNVLSETELEALWIPYIEIEKNDDDDEDDVEELDFDGDITEGNVEMFVDESIANVQVMENLSDTITLEDLEAYFGEVNCSTDLVAKRYTLCKRSKISSLRMNSLKYLLPLIKKNWIRKVYGRESIVIDATEGDIFYTPSTVFEKTDNGYFRTITFDAAHIANLLRESAAKGKLTKLGLTAKSLLLLSEKPGYAYLKKILSLKNSKLEFDPMNQRSSSLCFSEKTVEGLIEMEDVEGAKCCELLRRGIIDSFDTAGLSSLDRCLNVHNLKQFLYEKINTCDRMKRPGNDTLTNELLQMLHASLDSHIISSLNLEFFHPRRKSTGSVEQLFGQITMMCDGGMKLDCSMISDILGRVTITNALRLVPQSVKGFSFLAHLKTHMKSYSAEASSESQKFVRYPRLVINKEGSFVPVDSSFDQKSSKKRKTLSYSKMVQTDVNTIISDGEVRKHHKKF